MFEFHFSESFTCSPNMIEAFDFLPLTHLVPSESTYLNPQLPRSLVRPNQLLIGDTM